MTWKKKNTFISPILSYTEKDLAEVNAKTGQRQALPSSSSVGHHHLAVSIPCQVYTERSVDDHKFP